MNAPHRDNLRTDFPILSREINGKPLIYFDNAATAQKPRAVIDRMSEFLANENANIHRGVHHLSMTATDSYDEARKKVAKLLNVDTDEIIFTRGTTEGINLVANSFGGGKIGPGDEIILTVMEHHANIVPWQLLAEKVGAVIKVVPMSDEGVLDLEAYKGLLSDKTRMVALIQVSNVLGTINPAKQMTALAKEKGIPVLIDGAQTVPHMQVDVRDLDCDFFVFSAHKLFGPDGIGVLFGKRELLNAMPPYQGGGDMIEVVSFEGTTFREAPERFEAGTPNISGAIGLGAAIDYLNEVGWDRIHQAEQELLEYGTEVMSEIPGLTIKGTAPDKVGVISFTMDCAHPHDIGTVLDTHGIAIRTGHHCAQPLMERMGLPGTARASFAFYNTKEEIDQLAKSLEHVNKMFAF